MHGCTTAVATLRMSASIVGAAPAVHAWQHAQKPRALLCNASSSAALSAADRLSPPLTITPTARPMCRCKAQKASAGSMQAAASAPSPLHSTLGSICLDSVSGGHQGAPRRSIAVCCCRLVQQLQRLSERLSHSRRKLLATCNVVEESRNNDAAVKGAQQASRKDADGLDWLLQLSWHWTWGHLSVTCNCCVLKCPCVHSLQHTVQFLAFLCMAKH